MSKNISPHVKIYKFPITAISSIATRLSGLYLSGLFVFGGITCLCSKEDYFKQKYNNLSDNYKMCINYSLLLPLNYHTFGGLRHFIWDKYPKLLNNIDVVNSSLYLFGSTIFASIIGEVIISKRIDNKEFAQKVKDYYEHYLR